MCLFSEEHSRITVGIAGPDIAEDGSPGNWNNYVGCQSDTGRCFTSHNDVANTDGEMFGKGNQHSMPQTCYLEFYIWLGRQLKCSSRTSSLPFIWRLK